jgi:hypothetical protein
LSGAPPIYCGTEQIPGHRCGRDHECGRGVGEIRCGGGTRATLHGLRVCGARTGLGDLSSVARAREIGLRAQCARPVNQGNGIGCWAVFNKVVTCPRPLFPMNP